jgi:LacI family transcriptional regulator
MATMADVARLAGVSTATVSHVLNGNRPVNATTVAAVRDAIRRAGYTPNSLARSLARASSSTIGVAVSAITNHYFSDVVGAVESACSRRNFMMLLVDTHDDPEHQLRVVQELHQRRVDGIIFLDGVSEAGATPPLTVMAQPASDIGTVAVDLLMRRLKDPVAPKAAPCSPPATGWRSGPLSRSQ